MFSLAAGSRVFVLCPPQIATGGPESLHLLVASLRQIGRDARMVYVPAIADATPREYSGYAVERAPAVEDAAENLLIVPEIWAWRLSHCRAVQKAIWWLSVDNHLATESLFDFAAADAASVSHLVGSAYAESFVRGQGATAVAQLSSHVHDRFHAPMPELPRADRVLYNPKKGSALVERLIKRAPELEWRALDGLSREEMVELMCRSKVYVDFGNHPGKERLPREAALAGCCVVTGRKGSAAFAADLPIAAGYKLDDREPVDGERLERMLAVIRACVREFASRQREFADYREHLRGERDRFARDLRRLFG